MRTCPACGHDNQDDRDFCGECGEYLRWEPTQYVQAVAPPTPAAPAPPPEPEPEVAPEEPRVEQAAPPPRPPEPGNGHEQVVHRTEVQPPAPAPPAGAASITLRLPDQDAVHGETLGIGVEPGQRERVLALVRNQSGIVDNYELRVEGLPDGWWSIYPDTVYLVPYGTSGTYEQEVEVHLHPPRTPEAEARLWDLKLVAFSKANNVDATSEPLALAILPYTETATKVRPERGKGRRKADFTVDVANQANAPVLVALEGTDPDGELAFGFDRPPTEITPGQTVQTTMRVKPPKQLWVGRAVDKRFEVKTLTNDDAAERLAAEPQAAAAGPSPAAKRGRLRIPGMTPPQVFKPQLYEPGLQIGPGGINLRQPQFRAPQLRGPQMQARNIQLSNLKGGLPGGAAAAPAAPLLPSQGIFRQKAWLPWWLIPILGLLALLAVLLFMLMPKNVTVPDVVGSKSAFEAEKELTKAELEVAPKTDEKVTKDADPGTVIGQDPPAGEKAEKGSAVTLQIAIGNGKVTVPDITGKTASEAEQALRKAKLTLGQASPQPLDPAKKISTQIPEADQVVEEGKPVDIFFAEPGKDGNGGNGGTGGDGGNGGDGGGGGADITIPAIDGAATEEYAQKISDLKLVPETKTAFSDAKAGTLFDTDPKAGQTAKEGQKVTLLVSGGFPSLVFDNDQDVLRVNGASGAKLPPIAKSSAQEKDPAASPDGTRVVYARDDQLVLANIDKLDSSPRKLTPDGEQYADPAWAPTADEDVLAFGRVNTDGDRDLCFGRITRDGVTPNCIADPEVSVGSVFHWSQDGKTIFAAGVADTADGVVRWRSDRPFSTEPGDWRGGKIVNEDARDAALSPDGKTLAVAAHTAEDKPYELYFTKPNNIELTNAKSTTVRACKIAWQPDDRAVIVVQSNETCSEDVGTLVTVSVNDPKNFEGLKANGDNPVFLPLAPGG